MRRSGGAILGLGLSYRGRAIRMVTTMEVYRIWRILVGYKGVLIWLPIVATFFGLGLAYLLPEKYASTALVVVRPAEEINSMGIPVTRRRSWNFQ